MGAVVVVAIGWFGFHHVRALGCGARTCASPSGEAPLVLASGVEIPVVHRSLDEREQPVVDYLSHIDRTDTAALCAEVKSVWEVLEGQLDMRVARRAFLGPTNPKSEFLGLDYGIVPLYTCCVTTYFQVERDRSGNWTFPDCPQ